LIELGNGAVPQFVVDWQVEEMAVDRVVAACIPMLPLASRIFRLPLLFGERKNLF